LEMTEAGLTFHRHDDIKPAGGSIVVADGGRTTKSGKTARAEDPPAELRSRPYRRHAQFRLGERVRHIRIARGLTLGRLGEQSGLAASTLSKIENDQMSPTFEVLLKLAHGLGIDMDELLAAQETAPSGRRSITRAGQGRFHETANYAHEFLCTDLTHKQMVPMKTRVRARSVGDFPDWVRHEGEEFLLVLEGAVELHTELYEPVRLEAGDSIYYDAQMGHICISVSPEDALVLWLPVGSGERSVPA
jgi:transcriptional regulator with XRE-family HTH domain